MKEALISFLNWLRVNLPPFLAGFSVGYKVCVGRLNDAKSQIIDLEMRLAEYQNKEKVDEANLGKSDADIVDDAISAGATADPVAEPDGKPSGEPGSDGTEVPHSLGSEKPGE